MSTHDTATACLVCGPVPRWRSDFDGLLRTCLACGFAWTAAAMAPSPELYDESYFDGGGYEEYFLPAPRRYEASRRLRWLLSLVRPTSLIEAGPAGGFFVEAARRAGIAASGIDISESAARYARDQLGVPVRQGRFETAVPERAVQAVCAFHVLEHVDEPRAFLDAARTALVPGGWLVLEVPNVASPAARRLGPAWPGLQPEYHRWHFTPESLTRLVTSAGFRVLRQDTTVFRYYMPPRYRLRHAHRLLPGDWLATRSLRLTHARHGDLLRLVAALPDARRGSQ
ncbi:methyltransferase domain-containing protein [Micromonospora sp. NPDC050417]|uniref:class I SAM-dependent methyltransferase n=1 Tax=Micromonospora sp. NPDC050417 TaxID=3364280 RepID=UPI00379A3D2E